MTNKEWIKEYKKDLSYYDKGIFYHGQDEKQNDNLQVTSKMIMIKIMNVANQQLNIFKIDSL